MNTVNTVIVKTSSSCNLNCRYCYATDQKPALIPTNTISPTVLENLIRKSINASQNTLEYIWHGGEPLLVGIDFYKNVIEIQNRFLKANLQIINSIQTNATLITPEWAKFFKENFLCPGVSLDGPNSIHDSMRITNGHGSFNKTMRGISYLTNKEMYPNILAVVSKNSIGHEEEIFDFFIKNSLLVFDFLPYAEFTSSNNPEPFSLTAGEYGQFMINIFNLWIKKDDPKIDIRFFHNVLIGMLGGNFSLCTLNGKCTDFFAVDSNGDLYHCDWFFGRKEYCVGNIVNETFEEVMKKSDYKNLVSQVREIEKDCQACKWFPICYGGCSHHREIRGGFDKPYYFCEDRKMIFRHIENYLISSGERTIFS